MDITLRKKLRMLLEEEAVKHEYGCVMLSIDIPSKEWNSILDIIDKKDLYNGEDGNEESKYGLEKEPHITLLYGIHSNVPDEDVEAITTKIVSPKLSIKTASKFDSPECDVLKFDISSSVLSDINKKLSELPNTNEYEYHPHMTIAYLTKGTADKYIKIINNKKLDKNIDSNKIIYSKSDGSKKEYKFNENK